MATLHSPPQHTQPPTSPIYDLITIGFGTQALALGTAIHDYNPSTNILFLEQNHSFDSSLSQDADPTMQNSFLHDLATLRDPTSEFTFLNYLQSQAKLDGFIEGQGEDLTLPLRDEFHAYLTWAAGFFGEEVRYGQEVQSVSRENGSVRPVWRVESVDVGTGGRMVRFARNVVFANRRQMGRMVDEVEELGPTEMLDVTDAITGVPKRSSDERFYTLAVHSKEVFDEVFSENRLLLMRAML